MLEMFSNDLKLIFNNISANTLLSTPTFGICQNKGILILKIPSQRNWKWIALLSTINFNTKHIHLMISVNTSISSMNKLESYCQMEKL